MCLQLGNMETRRRVLCLDLLEKRDKRECEGKVGKRGKG